MEVEKKVKNKREWVKTAAIIFLAVLLVLTLFSQTIMNHSLPEVATQSVQSGSISAKIRGSGTIAANEVYEVILNQSRTIESVMVKQGQEVAAGDVLFILEDSESEEVKAAQETLDQLQLAYEKQLIALSNAAAQEDREVEKAQKAYNEALEAYHAYTTLDASQLEGQINAAQTQLRVLEQQAQAAQAALDALDAQYTAAMSQITTLESQVKELQTIQDMQAQVAMAEAAKNSDWVIYGTDYNDLSALAEGNETLMAAWAKSPHLAVDAAVSKGVANVDETKAKAMAKAYEVITADNAKINELSLERDRMLQSSLLVSSADQVTAALTNALNQLTNARNNISAYDANMSSMEAAVDMAQTAVDNQKAAITNLQSASTAADTLATAEEYLEDLLFEQGLSSSDDLDMQDAREQIQKQQEVVNKLKENYEAAEVTAKVGGVIGSINASAGNKINAGTALATINVVSRGYTIEIPVTNAQAKQVKLGDTAEVTNYYWGNDIEAVLEAIKNDPANPGSGKVLVFRITGEVEPGVNLSLSIGQKSAGYEALVPNSAVRTDTNGTFVLVVTSKNSPLGNRYVATRVDVDVLASDDTLTAVSGLSAGDFVITTSTKPIEAGMQVRLVDEQ